jgi:hypothetical protein
MTGVLRFLPRFGIWLLALECLAGFAAPVPPPQKLLPDDTLLMLTAPDFGKVRQVYQELPLARLWNDAAMKAFKDDFLTKWSEQVAKPLERELDIRLEDFVSLAQGQVTFALTPNPGAGKAGQTSGMLLLVDTKKQSGQLKTNLARLRRKWLDSGKKIRAEKIRDTEFSILSLSTNDLPATLKRFFPQKSVVEELGPDGEPPKQPEFEEELVLGQADTLFIMASSTRAVEKVLTYLAGSGTPCLGELGSFQANYQALFRDAPVYGWVNAKAFVERLSRTPAQDRSDLPVPDRSHKVLAAMGLSGLKSLAFTIQNSSDGLLARLFLGVPESTRQGMFKILAGEAKDCAPPSFVPADAVKFQRWRIDGQKAWATLEKMLVDFDPQALSALGFILNTASARAREKDPGFDLKRTLVSNLGDDIISYERAPRDTTAAVSLPPSLFLLSSPNAEALVAALKMLFVIFPGADSASEREFLGRKVFSTPALPSLPLLPVDPATASQPRTLSYAASGGYVAFSTDASMLEEYLRSSESQAKTLRETAGLTEAAQKVTGPGTDLFGFENQAETIRAKFEAVRKSSGSNTNTSPPALGSLPGAIGLASPERSIKEWMDFSLLPPYERVSKYFSFTVYGGNVTVDGLSFKFFAPTPPALRDQPSSR